MQARLNDAQIWGEDKQMEKYEKLTWEQLAKEQGAVGDALLKLWHARVHIQRKGYTCDCKEHWHGPLYGAKELIRTDKCAYHILHDAQAEVALAWGLLVANDRASPFFTK